MIPEPSTTSRIRIRSKLAVVRAVGFLLVSHLYAQSPANVVVVSSMRVEVFRVAARVIEGAVAECGYKPVLLDASSVAIYELRARVAAAQPKLVVTIGTDAANVVRGLGLPVPHLLGLTLRSATIPAPGAGPGTVVGVVPLDVPTERLLRDLKRFFPNRRRLGIIRNLRQAEPAVAEFQAVGDKFGITVRVVDCARPQDLLPAFHSLAGKVDFAWCRPDSSLYNATTIKPLLLASLQHRLPIIGFSESFLRAGAAVAAFPDFFKATSATAGLVRAYLTGRPVSADADSGCVRVGINQHVLRLLGVPFRFANTPDTVLFVE